MALDRQGEFTKLLQQARHGEGEKADQLFPLVYEELRRLAEFHMRGQRANHTLQATALVNEAYVRLVRKDDAGWDSRRHFFSVASKAMRSILVDHARAKDTLKRRTDRDKVPLDAVVVAYEERATDLVALDEALEKLANLDPRAAQIVELRFFGGLEIKEVAQVMKCSVRTIERTWTTARAWLYGEIFRKDKPSTDSTEV